MTRRSIAGRACGPLHGIRALRARRVASAVAAALALAAAATATADVLITPTPNVRVNTRAPNQLVEDYKSPAVAVNPQDPNQVVAAFRHDSPDYNCHIYYSGDGGKSWTASTFPAPPKGTCWSPSVAFDGSNTVYVAAQNRPPGGGGQDIIVWKSTDAGKSFSFPGTNASGEPGGPRFPGFQAGIAVDTQQDSPHRGRIYLTWYNFPNYPASIQIYLAYSDDGGASFSTPVTAPVAGEYQDFPLPVVGPGGTLYVVYKDIFTCTAGQGIGGAAAVSPSSCPIRVLRSTDGGQSLGGRFTVATATYKDLSAGEQPGIAVTPAGDVVVTFASLPPVGSPCPQELDVFVARSTDKAQTWSAPARLNDDPCTNGASQRDPAISVAPNGRVDAIFYDNRMDPGHVLYDVFYAGSTDGGKSFGPNVRVTDSSFDAGRLFTPRASGFQSNEFDQQNGVASTDSGAIAAWGDARNDPKNSTDVFTSRIGLSSSTEQPSPTPNFTMTPTPTPTPTPSTPTNQGERIPTRLVVRVKPKRDRRPPYRFKAIGRVALPVGTSRKKRRRSCKAGGKVKLQTKQGRRSISTRHGKLRRSCKARVRLRFAIPQRRGSRRPVRLKLIGRFTGNKRLKPATARPVVVKVG